MTRHLRFRSGASSALLGLGVSCAVLGATLGGCGDDSGSGGGGASDPQTTATSAGGGSQSGGGMGGSGTGGGSAACEVTAPRETRGSAVAVSPDDSVVVVANRDVGTVSVLAVDYSDGQPALSKVAELDLGVGSEPWQVAIDGCGKRAYVILRKDQRVVLIEDIDTDPTVGASVNVGSEPTSLVLSPNQTKLFVSNWVDGTVSIVNPQTMTLSGTVDLNAALAQTGLLGTVQARPSLAHPRAIAMTNDGDADDLDETVVVTEWYAQRVAPEGVNGADADTAKKGLLYTFASDSTAASVRDLPAVAATGFVDHNGAATGCYPNQVSSVTVQGSFAYVTSTCASPKGPIGVFAPTTLCVTDAQCGTVGGVCNLVAGTCNPNTTDVKTTTHPALTIVDLAGTTATTHMLDGLFDAPAVDSARMPHLPTDIGFFNGFAYLTAMGSDAVFRLQINGDQIQAVGSQNNDFINLRRDASDTLIRNPVGIATAHGSSAFAFVSNDGSRDVTALAFASQAIASGGAGDFRIAQASALPGAGSAAEKQLRGKRFFNTGLGRWSLGGEAWGSCAACHIDGLSDNISWYFARGPRQSTSLDGSFASGDPTDQRVLNWTALFDEIADFELNTRGVSGGLGAIVDGSNQRINLTAESPPQQGLQGSTADVADPAGVSGHPHSALADWEEIEAWIQTIRSPRAPTNLVQADVDAGRALFTQSSQGNCVGCHSGAKWTVSRRFYNPGDGPNAATNCPSNDTDCLSQINWNQNLNGFPAALLPVSGAQLAAGNSRMRFGNPPGAEQIQCVLRPVGTFGVSPTAVGTVELRQDMTTVGQGNADTGLGFNPPSLLGLQVGAPYFHAGNARTLEELLDDTLFAAHHRSAVAAVFTPDETQRRQLVAFMLAIDEQEPTVAVPAKGATGGDLCFFP